MRASGDGGNQQCSDAMPMPGNKGRAPAAPWQAATPVFESGGYGTFTCGFFRWNVSLADDEANGNAPVEA